MAKFISNDLLIYISSAGAAPVDTAPSAITKAKPAEVTATTTGLNAGDIAIVTATGLSEIDDNMFPIGPSAPGGDIGSDGTFNLIGSDTSASTGGFQGGSAKVDVVKSEDLTKICLRELEIGQASTSEIDTSTFCAESALPGPSTPGSITFTGYVDTSSDAYTALKAAADDGQERYVKFVGPDDQYWVGKVVIGDLSWSFPRGDVVTFTATGTQALKLEHRF